MGLLKDAAFQIGAGGSAGFVEVCLMHPLDLIKTRFQVQRGPDDPNRYKGLADCFVKIYRTEGILSFYKGILPPILAETPKRATKFFTFEQYKGLFTCDKLSLPMTYSFAGLCSGLTEAIVINPFEVVKVRLQTEMAVGLLEQKSAFATAREIIKANGFGDAGLNKGLTSTLGRHGVWNMIYFGLYHSLKGAYPPPKNNKFLQDPTANFVHRFSIGFLAGTLASIANIPFDVAKSRIQGPQPQPGVVKYHGCFRTIGIIYREEGFFALYKGLVPKVMRLGPGGAIMLIVYETVYDFFKRTF
uniref:Mitochondrial 2-oxodicarboxylate carrier n=1 Tax=Romanomermis culicivorax TaxID=13658 RepID=A0A915IDX5_ROMCU